MILNKVEFPAAKTKKDTPLPDPIQEIFSVIKE